VWQQLLFLCSAHHCACAASQFQSTGCGVLHTLIVVPASMLCLLWLHDCVILQDYACALCMCRHSAQQVLMCVLLYTQIVVDSDCRWCGTMTVVFACLDVI
jgi:hypothetical protein